MSGFAKVSKNSGGTNLEFNGNARHFTLTRANLNLLTLMAKFPKIV
jgi:hypothetical protein